MLIKKNVLPELSRPRRGYPLSIAGAIVQVLWKDSKSNRWPEMALGELYVEASRALGRQASRAVIRGVVYRHPDLFERVEGEDTKWRLSQLARGMAG